MLSDAIDIHGHTLYLIVTYYNVTIQTHAVTLASFASEWGVNHRAARRILLEAGVRKRQTQMQKLHPDLVWGKLPGGAETKYHLREIIIYAGFKVCIHTHLCGCKIVYLPHLPTCTYTYTYTHTHILPHSHAHTHTAPHDHIIMLSYITYTLTHAHTQIAMFSIILKIPTPHTPPIVHGARNVLSIRATTF